MATKKKSAPMDPLSALAKSRAPKKKLAGSKKFASGEHTWLGNEGARLAGERLLLPLDMFHTIERLSRDTQFEYGELVALSGDFYGSPSELYEELPAAIPVFEGNDIAELRKLFAKELDWIADQQNGRLATEYPEQNVTMAWNAKGYLELALRNVDHFGWHNVVAYVRHHTAAMQLAVSAKGEDGERWQRALVYNAFADHFLTDGFAAGHLRVPRAELREWATGLGWSDKLAGILSKLLHDQDGHTDSLHGNEASAEGLHVKNANGTEWHTFCDGQLFRIPEQTKKDAVLQPVEAVSASLVELVRAWKDGVLPSGNFKALEFVPFPHPKTEGLAAKFAKWTPKKIDALIKHCGWYAKVPWLGPGIKRAHVEKMIDALPDLMKRFATNVSADYASNPTLQTRIPKAYVKAYQSIR